MHSDSFTSVWRWGLHCNYVFSQPLMAKIVVNSRVCLDGAAEIRAIRSPALLIAVDHEGRRVQRFRDGYSTIPPMHRLGRLYDEDPAAASDLAEACGWLIDAATRKAGARRGVRHDSDMQ